MYIYLYHCRFPDLKLDIAAYLFWRVLHDLQHSTHKSVYRPILDRV